MSLKSSLAPSTASDSASFCATGGRARRLMVSGVAAACLLVSGFGFEALGPRGAQAGPLSLAPRADLALPSLTESVHYTGWRHRHRRNGARAAAAAFGAFGLILGATLASRHCRYVDPWGRCLRYRSAYYYGPSYYYPAYAGGYYPAYRRRGAWRHPRFAVHRGGPRFAVHRGGPRFAVHRAGPRVAHGGLRMGRHRR